MTTSRRHGTYITAAFELQGHSLTIKQGLGSVNLFCVDCDRNVIRGKQGFVQGPRTRNRSEFALRHVVIGPAFVAAQYFKNPEPASATFTCRGPNLRSCPTQTYAKR
jgi:hypothetical protein